MAFKLLNQIIGHRGKRENFLLPSDDRPRILRYFCSSGYLRISVIGKESEKEWTLSVLKSIKRAYFVSCYNGLALFTSDSPSHQHIVVYDWSNHHEMLPSYGALKRGDLCGFFFHPLAKEFRILSVQKIENNTYEYRIYLFHTKTWRRTLNPFFSCQPTRRVRSFNRNDIRERVNDNPAIVKNSLHWDIGQSGIMVFDMITEGFSIRCLPFIKGYNGSCRMQHILAKDDYLCLCYMDYEKPLMDIWILENYEKWSWVKKYVVNLHWHPIEKGFEFKTPNDLVGDIRVVGIQNGELLLFWKDRGMFSYHLEFEIVEKIQLNKSKMDDDIHTNYDWLCGFEAFESITR